MLKIFFPFLALTLLAACCPDPQDCFKIPDLPATSSASSTSDSSTGAEQICDSTEPAKCEVESDCPASLSCVITSKEPEQKRCLQPCSLEKGHCCPDEVCTKVNPGDLFHCLPSLTH